MMMSSSAAAPSSYRNPNSIPAVVKRKRTCRSRGRSNSSIAKVANGEELFRVRDMQERRDQILQLHRRGAVEASAEGEGGVGGGHGLNKGIWGSLRL
ncbi:uncharacterized protein DS421_11g336500 [Arachis hypogaea]|nr:uncharacterized protein DS421_11g336500 [Arachis hypogaea]